MPTVSNMTTMVTNDRKTQQQHQKDHREADHRDQNDRPVTTLAHISDDRRGAGDIGLDPGGRGRALDDVLEWLDGFVPRRLAGGPMR